MLTLLAQTQLDFAGEAADRLPGVSEQVATNPQEGFGNLIGGLLTAIMVIAAILVLLYLIWGAINWITAGGDKGKVASARERITGAIIGIIVLAATLAIFGMLQQFLGIEVLNFNRGASRLQDAASSNNSPKKAPNSNTDPDRIITSPNNGPSDDSIGDSLEDLEDQLN